MTFALTEEQAMIADTARAFFDARATSDRTRGAMAEGLMDRTTWTGFCSEVGLAGVTIPEEYGGAGLGMVELACIAEAAGSRLAAIPLLGHTMASRALVAGGTRDQKLLWLSSIASGDRVGAFGEGQVEEVDGLVSGIVPYMAQGADADLLMIASGDALWVVEAATDGVSIEPWQTLDQTRPLANVHLDRAAAHRLENGAAAYRAAREAGIVVLAAEALGGAQEALDRTVAYACERTQFGRPIGSFQAYKHRLADMLVEIEQARSAVYWAACAVDERADEAALALHAAKAFCADTYRTVAGNMLQLHGGIGFTWEHDAHLFLKRARSIATMLGDSDWHREQIAERLMGDAA